MSNAVQRSIVVHAPAEKLFQVIIDYEAYPEFVPNMKTAKVVSRGDNQVEVEFQVSLVGKRIAYSLAFDENPHQGIKWRLAKSDFLKENNGSWALRPHGEGSIHATYTLEVKVGLFIPKAVSTALAGAELPKVLQAFKARAEG